MNKSIYTSAFEFITLSSHSKSCYLLILLLLFIPVVSCLPLTAMPPNPAQEFAQMPRPVTVVFKDKNLEIAIRNNLTIEGITRRYEGLIYKPMNEDITLDELFLLTKIEAANSTIIDLSGLENCINLTNLNLSNNEIVDITPLLHNPGLGWGDLLLLQNNKLDLSEGSDDIEKIKRLQTRGVAVLYRD